MLTFIKRTATSWQHDNGTVKSSFGGGIPITNDTDNTIIFQLPNGTNFPIKAFVIADCKIIDKTDGDAEYTFATTTEFWDKLEELNYPFINTGGGGGGGMAYTDTTFAQFMETLDAEDEIDDADLLNFTDDSQTKQKTINWSNFKGYLKEYLDTVYATASAVATAISEALTTAETYTDNALEDYTNTTDLNALLEAKSDKELHLYQETDRNLSNATGAQNIFDTSTVSMLANSVYRFTLEFNMTGLSNTTNALNYIQLAFDAGTVGVSVFQYRVMGVKANQTSSSTPQLSSFNSTSLINVTLNTTATEGKIFVSGSIKTSTAGTFQPQVGMGIASSGVVKAGATFVAKILN